jgi:hypothetical protein
LVKGGWATARSRLYDKVRANEKRWEELLKGLVLDPPSFDEAMTVVERALRFLRDIRPQRR